MRLILIGAIVSTTIGGIAVAQRERLPRECRQEIVALCRGAEGSFGECLRTALPRLSDSCRKAIGERAAA